MTDDVVSTASFYQCFLALTSMYRAVTVLIATLVARSWCTPREGIKLVRRAASLLLLSA